MKTFSCLIRLALRAPEQFGVIGVLTLHFFPPNIILQTSSTPAPRSTQPWRQGARGRSPPQLLPHSPAYPSTYRNNCEPEDHGFTFIPGHISGCSLKSFSTSGASSKPAILYIHARRLISAIKASCGNTQLQPSGVFVQIMSDVTPGSVQGVISFLFVPSFHTVMPIPIAMTQIRI
jgi:hypothetical protein